MADDDIIVLEDLSNVGVPLRKEASSESGTSNKSFKGPYSSGGIDYFALRGSPSAYTGWKERSPLSEAANLSTETTEECDGLSITSASDFGDPDSESEAPVTVVRDLSNASLPSEVNTNSSVLYASRHESASDTPLKEAPSKRPWDMPVKEAPSKRPSDTPVKEAPIKRPSDMSVNEAPIKTAKTTDGDESYPLFSKVFYKSVRTIPFSALKDDGPSLTNFQI